MNLIKPSASLTKPPRGPSPHSATSCHCWTAISHHSLLQMPRAFRLLSAFFSLTRIPEFGRQWLLHTYFISVKWEKFKKRGENEWMIFLISILFKSRSFPAYLEHWLSMGILDITPKCISMWLNSSSSTPSHLTPHLNFLSLLKEPYLLMSTVERLQIIFHSLLSITVLQLRTISYSVYFQPI